MSETSNFPNFSIRPILEHYGFEGIRDDWGWHDVRCMFHGDRTPSFGVNTVENISNCRACGRGGNAVQLIMQEEGLSYASAVKRAQEISGESYTPVRGIRGGGGRVSKRSGSSSSGRAFKRAGGRKGSSSGTRGTRG